VVGAAEEESGEEAGKEVGEESGQVMSPITDIQRFKEIQERSAELWRIDALPDSPEKPFVLVSQSDRDVKFLLEQIASLHDEIERLEEMLEKDEDEYSDDEPDA
jgi:hypothetical protein